jgi:hypothetical protein
MEKLKELWKTKKGAVMIGGVLLIVIVVNLVDWIF